MAKVVQLKVEGDCECLLKVGSTAILCLTDDWAGYTLNGTAFAIGTVAAVSKLYKSTSRNKCCVGEETCEYTVNLETDQFVDETTTPQTADVTGITLGNCVTLALIVQAGDMAVNANTLANDLFFKLLKAGTSGDLQSFFKLNDDNLLQIATDLKYDVKTFTPSYYAAGGAMDWNGVISDNWYYRFGEFALINATLTQSETTGSAANVLRLGMPDGLYLANNITLPCYAYDSGSGPKFCQANTNQAANEIHFYLEDGANWSIDPQTGPGFTGIVRLRDTAP